MKRGMMMVVFLALSLLASTVAGRFTSEADYVDSYRLRASGTSLVDGFGNIVPLVGISIDHNEYRWGYFSIEDVQKMKSYGGTVMEIHGLKLCELMPKKGIVDLSYFTNNIDAWVSWCEQLHMYYIIDLSELYWTSWGSGMPDWMLDGHNYGSPPYEEATVNQAYKDFFDIQNPSQNDNRQVFTDLWKFIANRYKNNQFALFSIMNEPLSHVEYADEAEANRFGIMYSQFMEQVVDGIRSTGAEQLIFINKPYVWTTDNVQPVNRPNIVWEDHAYVNYDCDFTLDQWKSLIQQFARRYVTVFQKPFYMGEFAILPHDTSAADWQTTLSEMVDFLKSQPVVGYSYHSLSVLYGEYSPCYNAQESETILKTLYNQNDNALVELADITGIHGVPDGRVDLRDLTLIARLFNVNCLDPRYDPRCDFNGDGRIDLKDIVLVARYFGYFTS